MAAPKAPNIQNITVFSDASYCPDTHAAGGAYWARSDTHRAQGAFSLEGVTASHEAEVMAACNGVLQLAQEPSFRAELEQGRTTRLVLVVDCLAIKQALEGSPVPLSVTGRKAVTDVLALRKRLGFFLKVNHVKAHTGGKQPRQWVNRWCDTAAREKMMEGRQAHSAPLA